MPCCRSWSAAWTRSRPSRAIPSASSSTASWPPRAVATRHVPSDLAREVRYRCFDRPFFEAVQDRVYRESEAHLRALSRAPEGSDRAAAMAALVVPEPLVAMLTPRFSAASPLDRRAMLEVLTRRYYRVRGLQDVETLDLGDRSYLTARYERAGRRVRLVTTHATEGDLEAAARGARPVRGVGGRGSGPRPLRGTRRSPPAAGRGRRRARERPSSAWSSPARSG